MKLFSMPLILAILAGPLIAQAPKAALKDGVISYTNESGGRSEIQVGGPCADLWVAPDGDTMAFVRIDRSEPGDLSPAPFIEESTIFVASSSSRFSPVRVALQPPWIEGREWRVFRDPVVSPDLKAVYFLVPAAGTSWLLMSAPTAGGKAHAIAYVESYCVLWGGEHSGDLLMMARHMDAVTQGVTHWYYRNSTVGGTAKVGTREEAGDFGEFVSGWVRKHGGSCQYNLN
jgi:hypothetical protein